MIREQHPELFVVSDISFFFVACEACSISTPAMYTEKGAQQKAQELGFLTQATPEDGILNFCRNCAGNNKP